MKEIKPGWLVYEGESIEDQKRNCDRGFRRNAIAAAAVCIVLMLISVGAQLIRPDAEELLARSEYGGGDRTAEMRLSLLYEGKSYSSDVELRVLEKDLSEAGSKELFKRCSEELPSLAAADGCTLILPSEWNGVTLSWHSENEDLISDDGRINLPLEDYDTVFPFTVIMSAGGWTEDVHVELPSPLAGIAQSEIARQISSDIADGLSADSKGESLKLPSVYRGIPVEWGPPGVSIPSLFPAVLILAVLAMYFSRYDSLKKDAERRAKAFEASVPDLSLRLVLLLNAGLVVSSALDELLRQTRGDPSPLYIKMNEIRRLCSATNSSFEAAFSEYAASTGNRDLMRIAAMIYENSGRGSELAGKLEAERSRQWYERLNAAKARAGEAETKLCLPLMILMIVLVIIATAPALMDM